MNKILFNQHFAKSIFALLFLVFMVSSCADEIEIPEEGSIADLTPPSADFTFEQSDGDHKEVSFSNVSISATDYAWDFGDGTTSTSESPTHTYAEDGEYTVKLTATDKLNVSSSLSEVVKIEEPIVIFTPEILNPSFDIQGDDDYRDDWRNSDLGGVIQITSSPVYDGEKAAKLPTSNDRIGYQLIDVLPDTDYILSFQYTMKDSPAGTLTVAVLGGDVTDPADIPAKTLNSETFADQSDPSSYVLGSVAFNSGGFAKVAIYFSNVDVECRIDAFTIVEN